MPETESHRLPTWLRLLIARRLARPERGRAKPERLDLAIYKVDQLGDFTLALGAIHTLLADRDPARCRLVISTAASALAAMEFPAVPQWVVPPSASGVWREMRSIRRDHAPVWGAYRFKDLAILRHGRSLYRDVSARWIQADRRHQLESPVSAARLSAHNRPCLDPAFPMSAHLPWCRELVAHAQVLEHTLGRPAQWTDVRPGFQRTDANDFGTIVWCPFGGAPIRDLPLETWLAAWESSGPPLGPTIVVAGSSQRRDDLFRFASALATQTRCTTRVLCDLPGREFIELIARAHAVVTVESAAAHLATAFDKPAVIALGGGHHGWFAPWGDALRQQWVDHPMPCYGCNWTCHQPTIRCLQELPAHVLSNALNKLWQHA